MVAREGRFLIKLIFLKLYNCDIVKYINKNINKVRFRQHFSEHDLLPN